MALAKRALGGRGRQRPATVMRWRVPTLRAVAPFAETARINFCSLARKIQRTQPAHYCTGTSARTIRICPSTDMFCFSQLGCADTQCDQDQVIQHHMSPPSSGRIAFFCLFWPTRSFWSSVGSWSPVYAVNRGLSCLADEKSKTRSVSSAGSFRLMCCCACKPRFQRNAALRSVGLTGCERVCAFCFVSWEYKLEAPAQPLPPRTRLLCARGDNGCLSTNHWSDFCDS